MNVLLLAMFCAECGLYASGLLVLHRMRKLERHTYVCALLIYVSGAMMSCTSRWHWWYGALDILCSGTLGWSVGGQLRIACDELSGA